MKLLINKELVAQWRQQVGGTDEGAALIKKLLCCSYSKADKIASGRYPSAPTPLERRALAKLMKVDEAALFPESKAGKRRAS